MVAGVVAEPFGPTEESGENAFTVEWVAGEELRKGPLSVLWTLIEGYQVDIFSVSLERITRDFIAYLQARPALDLRLASDFALMAANLIYYKSRELLPHTENELDDGETPLPPELVWQLLEFKKFQLAAARIREMEEAAGEIFYRPPPPPAEPPPAGEEPLLDVRLMDLIMAFSRVYFRPDAGAEPQKEIVASEQFTVTDKMDWLRLRLATVESLGLFELFNERVMARLEMVVTFLAILEMVKQRLLYAAQQGLFHDIRLSLRAAPADAIQAAAPDSPPGGDTPSV